MPVFKVYLNGKKISSAGVGETGVLGAHVSWVRRKATHMASPKPGSLAKEELILHVGGLATPADEHLRWLDRKLKVGDEVRIRIVENAPIDQPRGREKRNPSKELRAQKRYVREMASKFGWKITSR